MNRNQEILTELEAISPGFPYAPHTPYAVPEGYFDRLVSLLLDRVQELDLVASLPSRTEVYEVPAGYFDQLPAVLLEKIHQDKTGEDPATEIEELSPLLAGLKSVNPYSVPAGYFDEVAIPLESVEMAEAPVVKMGSRRNWLRYAAAAVTIAAIAGSAFFFIRQRQVVDPSTNPEGWVAKNLKHVSNAEVQSFIQVTAEPAPVATNPATTDEIVDAHDLLKDVPTDAMQHFVSQTDVVDDEEILFN